MKVFINKPTGGYVGGLIVVAANSPMEAHGAMCAENESLAYWYEANGWQELTGGDLGHRYTSHPCTWRA